MAGQLTMDRIDRQLLNLLQTDARRTARSLSEAVPISAAAIRRRIRRLRNAGIIRREIAVLDRHFRDQRLQSVLLVRLRPGAEREDVERLVDVLTEVREVTFLSRAEGEFDLIVHTLTRSVEALDEFMDRHLSADGPVLDVTRARLSEVAKDSHAVFLDRADGHHWAM